MIGIYIIINNVNNKIYIGQSWKMEERWKKHRSHTHNQYLKNSIIKYGIENFSFNVLFEITSYRL
jgi:group I intron endonuclease